MTTPGIATPARHDELARRLQSALGDAYVVERELGAGGMAVVFLVGDVALKRKLAVKVVSPDRISSTTVLERFKREAETVAQLSHPNIVPLHFIGQQDDLFYIAMGYVDGGSLDNGISSIAGKQMPIEDVRRAMIEVGSALAHAHKRGVIHRDIKPQNVLIDSDSGRCLVTDFGIARTEEGTALTASGMIIGTPAYLAPEQVAGESSDHRADLYALGVMAYEMVTGTLPFDAPTAGAMMLKRLGPPPDPVGKVRPGVPRDIQDAISGCLAPNPVERFQRADDVVFALGGVAATGGGQANAEFVLKRRRRKARRIAAAIGAAVILVAAGAYAANRATHPGVPTTSAPTNDPMASIPAGDYIVGSDDGPASSRPAHRVQLPAFSIERNEVTVAQFKSFADSTGAAVPWDNVMPAPTLPVTRVTWTEAAGYCKWKYPAGGNLPSEEEWEAAARGTAGRNYPWGLAFDGTAANTTATGRNAVAPVGSFPQGATSEGVNDLIGNVWEWTRSPYQAYAGGAAMADSLRKYRVIRGGGYNSNQANATTSRRGYSAIAADRAALEVTGFRCVTSAPSPVR